MVPVLLTTLAMTTMKVKLKVCMPCTVYNKCHFIYKAKQWLQCAVLPSRLALSPEGSSKLHPFSDAPSALEHSIFTP